MAKLSEEQAAQLAELEKLRDAPEEPENGGGTSRVLNIGIDLGDEDQIKRAIGLGLLTPAEVKELDDDKGDDDKGDDGEDGPKRRGYFGDEK